MPDRKVTPLTPPASQFGDESRKVQAWVDPYTAWVLDHLVGIKGRSAGDVAYFILRDWIQHRRDELLALGISAQVADAELVVRQRQESTGPG